ncbi:helix-turn-helix domain-containing protein [Paenacidovorax monticola]|nr:helix-turn-helix domain-containing protein [Paenacidovorax monticola]
MSEVAEQMVGTEASMAPTAGTILREARQAAGVHVAALAVALKVPVSKLEALEADNFGALPDAVFTRALASSICRTLKIDPAPVLERLPQSQPPRLSADSGGLNAAFKDPHAKAAAPLASSSGSRSVVMAVLALLVGAAVVYFLPRGPQESASPEVPAAEAAAPAPTPAAEPAPAAAPAAAVAPAVPAAPTASAAVAAPAAVVVPAAAPASVAAQAPVASASAAAAQPAVTPSGIVEFRARAESWIQVRDASGTVTLQRSLAAGETASASGKLPLSVIVGKASATEVLVRGTPFDLASVARENVARFEVK